MTDDGGLRVQNDGVTGSARSRGCVALISPSSSSTPPRAKSRSLAPPLGGPAGPSKVLLPDYSSCIIHPHHSTSITSHLRPRYHHHHHPPLLPPRGRSSLFHRRFFVRIPRPHPSCVTPTPPPPLSPLSFPSITTSLLSSPDPFILSPIPALSIPPRGYIHPLQLTHPHPAQPIRPDAPSS